MIELIIDSAMAQPVAPGPLPEFSQYPGLNVLSAAFTLAIGVFSWVLWLRGQTAGGSAAKQQQQDQHLGEASTRIYLDGPMQKFLGDWERVSDALERIVANIGEAAQLRADFTDQLRETRHHVANISQGAAKDVMETAIRLEERLRRIELDHNTLQGTVAQIQRQVDGLQSAVTQHGRSRG